MNPFRCIEDNPFIRFKGGGKVDAPPPSSPTPTPREIDEEQKAKDRARRRQRIAALGRGGTILTESSGPTGQSTLLGGGSA